MSDELTKDEWAELNRLRAEEAERKEQKRREREAADDRIWDDIAWITGTGRFAQ